MIGQSPTTVTDYELDPIADLGTISNAPVLGQVRMVVGDTPTVEARAGALLFSGVSPMSESNAGLIGSSSALGVQS